MGMNVTANIVPQINEAKGDVNEINARLLDQFEEMLATADIRDNMKMNFEEVLIDGVYLEKLEATVAARFYRHNDLHLVTSTGDTVNVSEFVRRLRAYV